MEHEYIKNMSFEDRMKYYEDLKKMKRDIANVKVEKSIKPLTEEDWGDEEDDGDSNSSMNEAYGRDYGDEDDGGDN
tara:strand:+ start:45 stop:272 length:228 start_codon:yes stop_codon:yes gene_type:complete